MVAIPEEFHYWDKMKILFGLMKHILVTYLKARVHIYVYIDRLKNPYSVKSEIEEVKNIKTRRSLRNTRVLLYSSLRSELK